MRFPDDVDLQERRDALQEAGPFVDANRISSMRPVDRERFELLAIAAIEALRCAKSASLNFEWCRPHVQGANSAALAVAALENLWQELKCVDELHGLRLTSKLRPRG